MVGSVTVKCLLDLDEAERLAGDAIQLKPSPPSGSSAVASAAAATAIARSTDGSTAPSLCTFRVLFLSIRPCLCILLGMMLLIMKVSLYSVLP